MQLRPKTKIFFKASSGVMERFSRDHCLGVISFAIILTFGLTTVLPKFTAAIVILLAIVSLVRLLMKGATIIQEIIAEEMEELQVQQQKQIQQQQKTISFSSLPVEDDERPYSIRENAR